MRRIYVLHPGSVLGFKGIKHFDADDLVRLYKVELEECVIYNGRTKLLNSEDVEYIHLRPRGDGNYKIS